MYFQVFIVGLLAAMSPGPDFFVVMKNSLGFGRRVGIATAIGVAWALVVHIIYTILGFAVILQKYPLLFSLIQLLGAGYLIWLGWNAIKSNSQTPEETEKITNEIHHKSIYQGFKEGFLCNILNPKAALFFLSVFSQFITTNTPDWMRWLYGIEIIIAVGIWFIFLSIAISHKRFRILYHKYSYWFDRLLGAVIILFALRIIFIVIK